MSGLGLEITPDAMGIGITIPESRANDPVTKAVYNNLLGNTVPKPRVTLYCKDCNLEFASQVVLDTHIAGSKHQRKVQSKQLLKSLEETESGFEKNAISGVITCTICDVTVNSPQLLATHVAGNKHQTKKKGKRLNGEDQTEGAPTKKKCKEELILNDAVPLPKVKPLKSALKKRVPSVETNGKAPAVVVDGAIKAPAAAAAAVKVEGKIKGPAKTPPKKKERPALNINIPSCVTKLEDNKTGGTFICNPCKARCNSDVQLQQHLESKKHLDKVSGKKKGPPPPSTARGTGRGWNRGGAMRGRGGGRGAPVSKWSANYTPVTQKPYSSNYSQQYDFEEPGLTASFSDGFGFSSLGRGSSGTSDYGFTKGAPSRGVRGNGRGRGIQTKSYPPRAEEMPISREITYGRTEASYTRRSTEYPVRATTDYSTPPTAAAEYPMRGVAEYPIRSAAEYSMRTTAEYPPRATAEYPARATVEYPIRATSEYPTPKFDYHNQRQGDFSGYGRADYGTSTAGFDYGTSYGANGHTEVNNGAPRGAVAYSYTQPLSQNFVSGGSIL